MSAGRTAAAVLVPALAVVACVAALNEPPMFVGLYWRNVFVWTVVGVLAAGGLTLIGQAVRRRKS